MTTRTFSPSGSGSNTSALRRACRRRWLRGDGPAREPLTHCGGRFRNIPSSFKEIEMARATSPILPAHVVGVGSDREDMAKLLLRAALGLLMLLHGIGKFNGGIEFVQGALAKAGLPSAFAYLVYVGEILAPLLLIAGVWTRLAAGVVAINMVVAIALVHAGQLGTLSPTGGWAIELQALYLVTAAAVALLGAGRFSVAGSDGRWN
jgi:putative oxidoreductase